MAFVPLRKAVAALGLSTTTLRKYADEGTLPSIRNPAGQRLFDVDAYLRGLQGPATVIYARVSSSKQRDDLVRQIDRLQSAFPEAEVIQDVASGLNFQRKGLRTILERLLRGDKLKVVVAHRDRLVRFGFDLLEFLVEKTGGSILVFDEPAVQSREAELTADLLAILHHFSCRVHGSRSHQGKKNQDLPDDRAEKSVQEMARDFSICLQRNSKSSVLAERPEAEPLDGSCEAHTSEPS